MATRYCDLTADFVGGRSGADSSSNVLTGPGGLQTYLSGWDTGSVSKIAAGDLCYVKGTADLSKFFEATVSTDKSATWAIGDTVRDGTNQTWTGKLCYITSTALWIQIDAASGDYDDVSTAEDIENTTQSDSITAANFSSKDCPGIGLEVNGTSTNFIKMIGVNSSWSDDGTLAVFDAKSTATYCIYIKADNGRYWFLKNLDLVNAASDGFDATSSGIARRWVHCRAKDNASDGWYAYQQIVGHFHKCIARDNGADGFSYPYYSNSYTLNLAQGNGSSGIELGYGGWAVYNVSVENSTGIYQFAGEMVIANCAVSDNTSHGINCDDDDPCIIANRLTGNGGYGIYFDESAADYFFCDYNVFYNNTSGARSQNQDSHMSHFNSDTSPGEDGYVDSANDNYNVDDGVSLDSEGYILNWSS